jgi:ribosomal protein L31E
MTWRELKNFINKRARNNKLFLDSDVNLYNFEDGSEYPVDTTELSCNKEESDDENGTNWVAYLSINDEGSNNETETKEASVD